MNRKFFNQIDLAIAAAIIVLLLGGVGYAAYSGVIAVPGVRPRIDADRPSSPPLATVEPSAADGASVSPDVSPTGPVGESPTAETESSPSPVADAADGAASPSTIASASPATSASPEAITATVSVKPSPTGATTPSASPTAAVSPSPLEADRQAKELDLPAIQVALKQYKDKKRRYPLSASFTAGRTDSPNSTLKPLVEGGYMASLPVPADAPSYWYGYKSDGKGYTLTARLRNTTDPDGRYDEQGNYLYSVTNP